MKGDPANMIRGWSEIARMLGLYEPGNRNPALPSEALRQRARLMSMSDDQLLKLATAGGEHCLARK